MKMCAIRNQLVKNVTTIRMHIRLNAWHRDYNTPHASQSINFHFDVQKNVKYIYLQKKDACHIVICVRRCEVIYETVHPIPKHTSKTKLYHQKFYNIEPQASAHISFIFHPLLKFKQNPLNNEQRFFFLIFSVASRCSIFFFDISKFRILLMHIVLAQIFLQKSNIGTISIVYTVCTFLYMCVPIRRKVYQMKRFFSF